MSDHDMTTGEAEAWRAGWRAATNLIVRTLIVTDKAIGDRHLAPGALSDIANTISAECAIPDRAMQPPEPGRKA